MFVAVFHAPAVEDFTMFVDLVAAGDLFGRYRLDGQRR